MNGKAVKARNAPVREVHRATAMNTRPVIVLTLAAAMASAAATRGDTVELMNGDRLNGRVVQRTTDAPVFEHALLGRLTIVNAQIKSVTVNPPVGGAALALPPAVAQPVTPPAGQPKPKPVAAVQPSAAAAPQPAAKPAAAPTAQAAAQPAKAAAPTPPAGATPPPELSPFQNFVKDWKSHLELGLNGSAGDNDIQSLYLRVNTKKDDGKDRWLANAQWLYSQSHNRTTQNQADAEVTKDWLAKDRPWFLFAKGLYKHDQFRTWRNRASGFGGAGYTFLKDNKVEINGRLGFGGTYEFGSVNDFTPEALFGGSIMKWQINDRQTMAGECTWYPSLVDEDHYRIVGKVWWQYALDVMKGLSLKIGMENEYDSQTQGDDKKNDFKYYAALVLDF
jgi:putative salt-induced outer membrane protein YdiY